MGVLGARQVSGWPDRSKSESHGDAERDLDEAMQSRDPRRLWPYNKDDNGQRDAGKPIGALIETEKGAKESKRKYRHAEYDDAAAKVTRHYGSCRRSEGGAYQSLL